MINATKYYIYLLSTESCCEILSCGTGTYLDNLIDKVVKIKFNDKWNNN